MESSSELSHKRVRVLNFAADEKALLAQLTKKKSIIESEQTDGKVILKKKSAWVSVTEEFNSDAHVHKRDTITLKRAWDNMKAFSRKARATERGNFIRAGGGPFPPSQPPHQEAIISLVDQAAPNMVCEINNIYDSDGTISDSIKKSKEFDFIKDTPQSLNEQVIIDENASDIQDVTFASTNIFTVELNLNKDEDPDKQSATENKAQLIDLDTPNTSQNKEQYVRKTSDYVRREAVQRLKWFENKKKIELQILKEKLETEQIKKRTALLEEERHKLLLEEVKTRLNLANTRGVP